MKIYHHDKDGFLVGEGEADADPLDAGRWLIPAHAVEVEPPAVPDGMRAKWNGAAWALEPLPLPEPEPLPPSPAEIRRGEIMGELASIDQKSIRALRENDATRIAQWEAQAVALRAELAGLGV